MTYIIVALALVTFLVIFLWWRKQKRTLPRRESQLYVCPVCNEKHCDCELQKPDSKN